MPKERNIIIVEVKPPIPTNLYDYCAYLGGEDPPTFYGWGATEEAAKEDLLAVLYLDEEVYEDYDEEVGEGEVENA